MQNETKQNCSGKARTICSCSNKRNDLILFIVSFLFVLLNLISLGSMINRSGDAADIWKTITTYYLEDRYPSYVLYKGFASIYPYVWFYQLALLLNVNEFFFVMCYHSLLFGYVTVFGIPGFVKEITGYQPKIWQKILIVVTLYWYWSRYGVLTQLMVDLPSCAYFFMSVHFASQIANSLKCRKIIFVISTGLLCGLCINISGQYSVAAFSILIYAFVKIWSSTNKSRGYGRIKKCKQILLLTTLLIFSVYVISLLNDIFEMKVIDVFRNNGVYIATADDWMHRALIYMMDIGRLFYGPQLYDGRGHAIILDYYGVELGEQMLQLASAGGFGWTITEYFQIFVKYPIDYFILYMNRMIIAISDDCKQNALHSLLLNYTMVYISMITAIKGISKIKDLINANFWLIFGAFASMIPVLVMTVEMRYTLSFQGVYIGVALLGPTLPRIVAICKRNIWECARTRDLGSLMNFIFPWEILGWIIFCFLCLGYFGAIVSGSPECTNSILFNAL